jgi:predicted aspartyl protease
MTGCLESAAGIALLQSDLKSATGDAAIERGRPMARPDEPTPPGPSAVISDEPSPRVPSDAYWSAVADLDVPTSLKAARTGAEIRFSEAVAMLKAGNYAGAESVLVVLGKDISDLTVAVASQIMLATALVYEHKWEELADLSRDSQLPAVDKQNIAGLERWGKAFVGQDTQVVTMDEPVSLPLGVTRVGTPTIRVRINGKEYDFWLDTGSSITVLSSKVAAAVRVSVLDGGIMSVGTFSGVAPVRPAILKRLEIGSIVLANTAIVVMDADLMRVRATAAGVPREGLWVDGIIGWDTIRQFDIALDYQNGRVTLRRPQDLGTRGTAAQNLTWIGKPLVEVRAGDGETLHFTLDTGAQGTFINALIVKEAGLATRSLSARVFGIGKTEGNAARIVPSLRVTVAGHSLLMKDLMVYAPSCSGLFNCDGILGSDLSRFGTIRIDATNGIFAIDDVLAD